MAKHPFITPGPSTVFTPPPTRHSTLPGVSQGVLAGIAMTGSLPHYYNNNNNSHTGPNMTPIMGLREAPSMCSSGYPTPRPGSSASGFDNSFSMGSPQIGQVGTLFRSFPRPHSSPKMKLRLYPFALLSLHIYVTFYPILRIIRFYTLELHRCNRPYLVLLCIKIVSLAPKIISSCVSVNVMFVASSSSMILFMISSNQSEAPEMWYSWM